MNKKENSNEIKNIISEPLSSKSEITSKSKTPNFYFKSKQTKSYNEFNNLTKNNKLIIPSLVAVKSVMNENSDLKTAPSTNISSESLCIISEIEDREDVLKSRFYTCPNTLSFLGLLPFNNILFSALSHLSPNGSLIDLSRKIPGISKSDIKSLHNIKVSLGKDFPGEKVKGKHVGELIAEKLCSSPSNWAIRVMCFLMTNVFTSFFSKFIVHGLNIIDKVREIQSNTNVSVVLVPTHRSHLDYLLLSYICFCFGLKTPQIAAGDNLNLPIVGSFLRNCGAFFIRRSFKDDNLYKDIISNWVSRIVNAGHSIEFFIEGTRSRNGRIGSPKYGILNYVFQALHDSKMNSEVMFVPVSFTYDHVYESISYAKESIGAPKIKESILDIISSSLTLLDSNVLRRGEVHTSFGLPILLNSQDTNMPSSTNVACEIMHNMVDSLPISMSSIISYLLFLPTNLLFKFACMDYSFTSSVKESVLVAAIQNLIPSFSMLGCNFSFKFGEIPAEVTRIINLFASEDLCKVSFGSLYFEVKNFLDLSITSFSGLYPIYSLANYFLSPVALNREVTVNKSLMSSLRINYSRNTLLQKLILPSILSASFVRLNKDVVSKSELISSALKLSKLLKYDFATLIDLNYVTLNEVFNNCIESNLFALNENDLVECIDNSLLTSIHLLVLPLIESYCAVLSASLAIPMFYKDVSVSSTKLIPLIQYLSTSWSKHWNCTTHENESLDLIHNVLKLLVSEQLIVHNSSFDLKEQSYYVLNEDNLAWFNLIIIFSSFVSPNLKKIDLKFINKLNAFRTHCINFPSI